MSAAAAARQRLLLAEIEHLVANGWTMIADDKDLWREPEGRRDRTLRHGHAVNSQKALDRWPEGPRTPRDHCTRCARHYDDCACDD